MESVGVGDFLGLGLSARTAAIYAAMIGRAEPVLAARGVTLADCGPADVAAAAAVIPRSHSSRGQLRSALLAAWTVLGRLDGPAKAVRVPRRPRPVCRALEPSAAELLERTAWNRNDDPGLAVLIGLYAALRRAEIAALAWADVVRDELGRPVWLRVIGKGDIEDQVPIHPVLAAALERRWRPSGFVFPGRKGTHVIPDTIWRWTALVAAGAGLTLTTHQLRHTSLAECNDRSHDLRTTQAIARHSRPETTSGYTRVTSARLLEVVSMIDYGHRLGGQEGVSV